MTATSLSGIAISTWLARWSDMRLSRRTVLLLGGVTGALSYVGYAYVRDVVWLTLIGCVLGWHLLDHVLPAFRLCPRPAGAL